MPIDIANSAIPVLLLYNLDPKWSAHEQAEVLDVTSQAGTALRTEGFPVSLIQVTGNGLDSILSRYDPSEYIVFNWCENLPGFPHSEWMVADYLEKRGFVFTGAGSLALALSLDKPRVKQLLEKAGILTPKWVTCMSAAAAGWSRFPAIVKPSRGHCSEGINRDAVVTTPAGLKERVRYIVKRFHQPALVEDFIAGRELHVSLWGNGKLDVLPPAEMEFSSFRDQLDWVCTYEAKFVPGSEQYQKINTILPAPLSPAELRDVEQACQAAFTLAGCRDYARIDVRMQDGLFYITDINPNADICPDTTTIAAANYAGYSYGDFLGRLVLLAAGRHPDWADDDAFPALTAAGEAAAD